VKILPVGAELFHADGRTDLTKLIVTFRSSSKTSKNKKKKYIEGKEERRIKQDRWELNVGGKALSTNLINDVNKRDVNVILEKVFIRLCCVN